MWHLLVNPKYKELWGKSYTKELGLLAQGIPRVSKGTNTIICICRKHISHDRKRNSMYPLVCVNYHPEKEDPNCTGVTVGGNLLHYPGDCSTSTVNMITVKLHPSSVISTKNARYCTINLKDFYLNTPMDQLEYMCMKISNLPILSNPNQQGYNLRQNTEGHVWSPAGRHPCTRSFRKKG